MEAALKKSPWKTRKLHVETFLRFGDVWDPENACTGGETSARACILFGSHDSLGIHGIGNLQETGNIGAGTLVALHAVFLGGTIQIMENIHHNAL